MLERSIRFAITREATPYDRRCAYNIRIPKAQARGGKTQRAFYSFRAGITRQNTLYNPVKCTAKQNDTMLHFTNTLHDETEKRLRKIESSFESMIERAAAASEVLEEALCRLKAFIAGYTFKDITEEIRFFKEVKPRMMSRLLFYCKVYHTELNKPVGHPETLAAYLHGELKRLDEYAREHSEFSRYYRSKATHLDRFYFLRGAERMAGRCCDVFSFDRDAVFSTIGDAVVAKILANGMLQTYLLEELDALEELRSYQPLFPKVRLTWRGSKAELNELLFALDSSKCFGDVPLTRLANYLQNVFNVELDHNLSRVLGDMRLRNEPTPFLDRLAEALLKRMKRRRKK